MVGVWCANKSSIYDDYRLMLSMSSSAALEDSIYLYLSYSKLAETHLPSLSLLWLLSDEVPANRSKQGNFCDLTFSFHII